jgi:hypothetical protein
MDVKRRVPNPLNTVMAVSATLRNAKKTVHFSAQCIYVFK